jgi:hypothetical protein
VHVLVYPTPTAPAITINGDTLISTPAAWYQWYTDETPISGATSQQYVAKAYGSYSVLIGDTNGCSAQSTPALLDADASSVVELGEYEAVPGEVLSIPLQLIHSQNLDAVKAHEYRATIRFDRRLLYPAGSTPQGIVDGDHRVVTLHGERAQGQQQGEIGTLELVAALGDTLETALEIELFVWEQGNVSVRTENGMVRIRPQGGWDLYRSEGRMALLPPQPNPAIGLTEVIYETIEPGRTQLFIIDVMGRRALTLIDADLARGRDKVILDTWLLATGSYFIILQTPSGRAIQPLQVER